MSKLVPVLLVVLIAGVGWQVLETARLGDDVRRLDEDAAILQAAVSGLERRLWEKGGEAPAPALRSETAPHPLRGARDEGGGDEGARLLPRGADPAVIAQAVRELQARVAEQESRVQGVEARVEAGGDAVRELRFVPPIRTVDEAATRLDLSAAQRADVERIVDYAQRDLEDLRNLPNAEGKTWKDVEAMKTTTSEGGLTMVMTNLAEVMKYRDSRIPGSSETYGEAEQRIRRRASTDIREILTPEQQKTWDDTPTDPLFGNSSGAGAMISFGVVTPSLPDEDD